MYVQGPNGVVIEVSGALATGLVGNGDRGYRVVPEPIPSPRDDENAPAVPKRKKRARKSETTAGE